MSAPSRAFQVLVLAVLTGTSPFASLLWALERPNIVIFFTDDAGYRDIGPFGGLAPTPQLDRMAKEGMKLTRFYVANVACTPSRAALMTGCYASRIGMDGGVVFPGDARGLNPQETTIAEMLKGVGYRTACFGKWHLGDQPEFMPLAQGFDEYEGIPYSNDMWDYGNEKKAEQAKKAGKHVKLHPPLPWVKGDKVVAWVDGPLSQALINDALARATVDFIDRHKDKPFFVYVPFPAVHNPKFALKERAEKVAALGCDPRHVAKYTQITEIDACVGKVMAALAGHGIDEKTLLFYTNDNGGRSDFVKRGTVVPRGGKFGPKYEGNMRISTLARWPGRIPAGAVCAEPASTIDLLPTFARLAGAQAPADNAIDGRDISAMLLGKGKSPHEVLYYETGGVRKGKWKFVSFKWRAKKGAKAVFREELYDLEQDFGETKDVAASHPDKVAELKKLLNDHAEYLNRTARPAGKSDNPKPLLSDPEGMPSLARFLGREEEQVYGE